ncbi:MAG: hypothetical protein HRT47_03865 [Candidatus Caenarcaniphilales bacterium]|nr:hypothetical protein [Candidatus Caenarcaniphilales bacterium]
MSIDINTLGRFDLNNDGKLDSAERSAYDTYADEEALTTIKDNITGIKGDLDLALVDQLDINGDGELGRSESQSLSAYNQQNNQINSSNFTPSPFEMDAGLANDMVDDLGENVNKSNIAFITLVKEFGSEDMARAIQENADTKYDGDSMSMEFNVDGIDFTLNTHYD